MVPHHSIIVTGGFYGAVAKVAISIIGRTLVITEKPGDTRPKTGNKIDFRIWIYCSFAHFVQPKSEQKYFVVSVTVSSGSISQQN